MTEYTDGWWFMKQATDMMEALPLLRDILRTAAVIMSPVSGTTLTTLESETSYLSMVPVLQHWALSGCQTSGSERGLNYGEYHVWHEDHLECEY